MTGNALGSQRIVAAETIFAAVLLDIKRVPDVRIQPIGIMFNMTPGTPILKNVAGAAGQFFNFIHRQVSRVVDLFPHLFKRFADDNKVIALPLGRDNFGSRTLRINFIDGRVEDHLVALGSKPTP